MMDESSSYSSSPAVDPAMLDDISAVASPSSSSSTALRMIELNATFYALFVVSILAAALTGSTLQWVYTNHLHAVSQYNILVTIATISSLIQTVTCFINTIHAPDNNLNLIIYILVNWVLMTHTSVMLVSNRLALTTLQPTKNWHRLLLINVAMLPLSVFICAYWSIANGLENSDVFDQINSIMEPIQIALWGLIEFCLSGAFIIQMWKFHWTDVERKAVAMLVLVGLLDILSILLNLFLGDLESTCVKGFVYCLRIKLEVDVLCTMVDFVKAKRRNPGISGLNNTGGHPSQIPLTVSAHGRSGSSISSRLERRRGSSRSLVRHLSSRLSSIRFSTISLVSLFRSVVASTQWKNKAAAAAVEDDINKSSCGGDDCENRTERRNMVLKFKFNDDNDICCEENADDDAEDGLGNAEQQRQRQQHRYQRRSSLASPLQSSLARTSTVSSSLRKSNSKRIQFKFVDDTVCTESMTEECCDDDDDDDGVLTSSRRTATTIISEDITYCGTGNGLPIIISEDNTFTSDDAGDDGAVAVAGENNDDKDCLRADHDENTVVDSSTPPAPLPPPIRHSSCGHYGVEIYDGNPHRISSISARPRRRSSSPLQAQRNRLSQGQ